MIDAFVNRIKDAYFDLSRDTARGERFYQMSQAFTPGAIQPSPSQMARTQQFPPNTPLGPQPMMPEMQQPAPQPEPSMLDLLSARR